MFDNVQSGRVSIFHNPKPKAQSRNQVIDKKIQRLQLKYLTPTNPWGSKRKINRLVTKISSGMGITRRCFKKDQSEVSRMLEEVSSKVDSLKGNGKPADLNSAKKREESLKQLNRKLTGIDTKAKKAEKTKKREKAKEKRRVAKAKEKKKVKKQKGKTLRTLDLSNKAEEDDLPQNIAETEYAKAPVAQTVGNDPEPSKPELVDEVQSRPTLSNEEEILAKNTIATTNAVHKHRSRFSRQKKITGFDKAVDLSEKLNSKLSDLTESENFSTEQLQEIKGEIMKLTGSWSMPMVSDNIDSPKMRKAQSDLQGVIQKFNNNIKGKLSEEERSRFSTTISILNILTNDIESKINYEEKLQLILKRGKLLQVQQHTPDEELKKIFTYTELKEISETTETNKKREKIKELVDEKIKYIDEQLKAFDTKSDLKMKELFPESPKSKQDLYYKIKKDQK